MKRTLMTNYMPVFMVQFSLEDPFFIKVSNALLRGKNVKSKNNSTVHTILKGVMVSYSPPHWSIFVLSYFGSSWDQLYLPFTMLGQQVVPLQGIMS